MQLYDLTLGPGQEIKGAIRQYVEEQGWSEALIVGAIGSAIGLKFNTPASECPPLRTTESECPQAAEVVGFSGEIKSLEKVDPQLAANYAADGCSLFVHIHACCVSRSGVYGGGLTDGRAFRSLRIFLVPTEVKQ